MIKFELIQSPEQLDQWRQFARTFNHDTEKPLMPLVMIQDGDYVIGHFHVLNQPVVFPAFHPSVAPRKVKDSVEAISAHYCLSSMGLQYPKGVTFCALPKGINPEIPAKLGFEPLNVNLYRKLPQ